MKRVPPKTKKEKKNTEEKKPKRENINNSMKTQEATANSARRCISEFARIYHYKPANDGDDYSGINRPKGIKIQTKNAHTTANPK